MTDISIYRDPFKLDLSVEIAFEGRWYSLDDGLNYKMGPEGFGTVEQTHRRKQVTSDYFEGDFTTRRVRDSVKRSWEVWVYGESPMDVQTNILNVVDWFTQDSFNLRWRINDVMTTVLAEAADYSVDQSHVMMHNNMAKAKFSFTTHPQVTRELIV